MQTAVLYLHYFPGDGEAIVRAKLAPTSGTADWKDARTARGKVTWGVETLEVNYAEEPLAREMVDTLSIDLIPHRGVEEIDFRVEIYSSGDPAGKAAHAVEIPLQVRPPIDLEIEAIPAHLFAGEWADLLVAVHNDDALGRAVEEIDWLIPDGLLVVGSQERAQWPRGLQAGERDTLRWKVQVDPRAPEAMELAGRATGSGTAGSPVPSVALQITPLPRVQVHGESGTVEVGQTAALTCAWTNLSAVRIELQALRVDLGPAFDRIQPPEDTDGLRFSLGREEGQNLLLIEGRLALESGEQFQCEIRSRPLQPGPFSWRCSAKPAGREDFVPLAGDTEVRVVRRLQAIAGATGDSAQQSDLHMLSRNLGASLGHQLEELPLAPGTQIYLKAQAKGNANWLIEDILAAELMARGYGICLGEPAGGENGVVVVHYRTVDARVVYTPLEKGWRIWRRGQQREVFGDLFLRFERADGEVIWTQRIRIYDSDRVAAGEMEQLGGGGVVDRTVVQPENKFVERGLSASIIGGLVYIFFIL